MISGQKNIILCGFMGSGKTTLGALLAARLSMRFVDMDDFIVTEAGMAVADIFAVHGETYFRELEHEAAKKLGAGQGLVIATGGGALVFERNIAPLKQNGIVIYLDPGFDECWRRIKESDRPLVRQNGRDKLEELYKTREARYLKCADKTLRTLDAEDAAGYIINMLCIDGDDVK